MVTMLGDDSIFAAMRAARCYVVKGAEPSEILRAARAVADSEAIFSLDIAERLIHCIAAPARLLQRARPRRRPCPT